MNIQEVISKPEYSFIRDNKYLSDNMILVTFGGSVAYGLNTPTSDIDIRGICFNDAETILGAGFIKDSEDSNAIFGHDGFEQYNDAGTDTVIYSFNKIVKLLYKCNPNTIEMLGCEEDHYIFYNDIGKYIIENSSVFLSKLAYESFAGYARGQFQRLKNALGKDSNGNFSRVISLSDSLERMHKHLELTYTDYRRSMVDILITDLDGNELKVNNKKVVAGDVTLLFTNNVTLVNINGKNIDPNDIEIRFNIHIDNLPSSQFSSVTNEINSNLKEFTKTIGHRNNKKDAYHLCKHAMHLLRLYMMGYDILMKEKIITYREDEHDLLMSIKNGKYFDGKTFSREFFDLVESYDSKLEDAVHNTKLPDKPEEEKIFDLIRTVNKLAIYGR